MNTPASPDHTFDTPETQENLQEQAEIFAVENGITLELPSSEYRIAVERFLVGIDDRQAGIKALYAAAGDTVGIQKKPEQLTA